MQWMSKLFMAGDRTDGLMNDITGGDAMAVPPRQAGPNSEPGSSFRDWAGNVSNFPREITETALAHIMGDKAEQASSWHFKPWLANCRRRSVR